MLGVVNRMAGLLGKEHFIQGIKKVFEKKKKDILDSNLKAFEIGNKCGEKCI
jgi:Pyruvate/2-oxoacid:ferredoxin oxidoreductase gamma subunit